MLILLFVAVSIIQITRQSIRVYGSLFTRPDFNAPREPFYQVSDQSLVGKIDRYRETPEDHLLANQYYNIKRGVGTITWLGNMVFPEFTKAKVIIDTNGNPVYQEGYLGEVYCIDSEKNDCEVSELHLTYNTIRFDLNTVKPSIVVLNFNFNSGWHSPSAIVLNYDGLLSLQVPANTNGQMVLRFSDPLFADGLVLAIITMIKWFAGGIFWIRRNRDYTAENIILSL